jgi:cyclopropane fatty-acyl-phospholipid synthase-like methyltransferase
MASSDTYYDALATDYAAVSEARENYLESINKKLTLALDCKNPSTLLDIGSGDGQRIHKLTCNRNIDVWVLENSCAMIEFLTKLFSDSHIFSSHVLEIANISKRFDMITALWNVFGHISEIEQVFVQIREKLNDGGLFVFDVNNPYNVTEYGLVSVIRNWWHLKVRKKELSFNLVLGEINTKVFFRSTNSYRDMLQRAGFTNVQVRYFNYSSGKQTRPLGGQLYFECT